MELTAPMTAALCFFGGVMACLLVCMALKLKAAQAGGRKQQKKDKPPATVGKRMGAMDKILIVLGVFLLCFIVAMVVIFIKKGQHTGHAGTMRFRRVRPGRWGNGLDQDHKGTPPGSALGAAGRTGSGTGGP